MHIADCVIAGKYRVIKKLGEGAMGAVWLAKNEVTDREFAIKVLLPEVAAEPAALARFFREARVCGSLRHPSILEIYDAGTAPELGDAAYLVMERLEGAPLDTVIRQRGALDPRLALDILIQCARGLHLAHLKGVVHRDLKPANIFLHRPGTGSIEPKVLDFGISKIVGNPSMPEVALTQSSTILGSPLYMSPEQMDIKTLDARSDVHALGVVLWECLTGEPPFVSTAYNNLVVEIMTRPRPRLRDALPSASPELATIVERAFALDPAQRFASAEALADALDEELAVLGGGVLASRTAATEVLGGLDLATRPPPALHDLPTQALPVDSAPRSAAPWPSALDAAVSQHAALVATAPAPQSEPRRASEASGVLVTSPSPGARRRERWLIPVLAGSVLLTATAGLLAANGRRDPAPASAASTTAATSSALAPPPQLPEPAVATSALAPAPEKGVDRPVAPPLPASAAPASPTARRTSPAPRPSPPAPAPAKPVARPRIDESGL